MSCNNGNYLDPWTVNICRYNSGSSDVRVNMTCSGSSWTLDWTMRLQRYVSGSWSTIGTRTGYLRNNSPSERTFTNVSRQNARTRVQVSFTHGGDYRGAISSHVWNR